MKIRTRLVLFFGLAFFLIFILSIIIVNQQVNEVVTHLEFRNTENLLNNIIREIELYSDSINSNRETAIYTYMRGVADLLYDQVEDTYNLYLDKQYGYNTMMSEVRKIILGATIVDSGYAFGLDSEGWLFIHKSSSANLASSAHIAEMMANKNGEIKYTAVTTGQTKIVSYRYFKPLDLIIAPGVNVEELEWLYDTKREEKLFNDLLNSMEKIELVSFGSMYIFDADQKLLFSKADWETPSFDFEKEQYQTTRNYRGYNEEFYVFTKKANNHYSIALEYSKDEFLARSNQFSFLLLVIALIAIIIITIILMVFGNKLLKPIKLINSELNLLTQGAGDLTTHLEISGNDETAQLSYSFNSFIEKLREIVVNLKLQIESNNEIMTRNGTQTQKTAEEIEKITDVIKIIDRETKAIDDNIETALSASEEINKSADTIQKNAFDQNSAVSESSAAIDQMIASINNIATIAEQRIGVMTSLSQSASLGQERMAESVESITHISNAADTIQELTSVIESIAQSTNLLAMNAAIEAAHAGEAGKGFSVVAEEIRKLAENTQINSKIISKNVSEILGSISNTQEVSQLTSDAIDEIVKDVTQVASGIEEILQGLKEMSLGTNEITTAITSLSDTSNTLADSTKDIHLKIDIITNTMSKINDMSSSNRDHITDLNSKIKNILTFIDNIKSMGEQAVDNAKVMHERVNIFKT